MRACEYSQTRELSRASRVRLSVVLPSLPKWAYLWNRATEVDTSSARKNVQNFQDSLLWLVAHDDIGTGATSDIRKLQGNLSRVVSKLPILLFQTTNSFGHGVILQSFE